METITNVHYGDIAESIALKLHLIAFKNVAMELGLVESGVEDLMDDLAEHICDLMVEYVKGLGMILWVLISGLRSTREG